MSSSPSCEPVYRKNIFVFINFKAFKSLFYKSRQSLLLSLLCILSKPQMFCKNKDTNVTTGRRVISDQNVGFVITVGIGRFQCVLIGQLLLSMVKGSWKVSIYMLLKRDSLYSTVNMRK